MLALRTVAALVLVALFAGSAAAQTVAQPIRGGFTDGYLVAGRVVDADGDPVAGARLTIEIDQRGVSAAPFRAAANCKGDFITFLEGLRVVDAAGRAIVRVFDTDNNEVASSEAPFDPFFRRSDVVVRYDGDWGHRCPPNEDVWEGAVSMKARVLNRTAAYEEQDATYHAVPYDGVVRLRYFEADGTEHCPPLANGPPGACEVFEPDARGDIQYSFTFSLPIEPTGRMMLSLQDGRSFNASVDPETRLAVFAIEATGEGPPRAESPGVAVGLVLVGVVAAATWRRRA